MSKRWAFSLGEQAVCLRPECGKSFTVSYRRRGYCSRRCWMISKRQRYNRKRREGFARVWQGWPMRTSWQEDFFENGMSIVTLRGLQTPSFILMDYPHRGACKERLPYEAVAVKVLT